MLLPAPGSTAPPLKSVYSPPYATVRGD
ncbi:hypothetical protein A2U01_0101583, partial [Trifolium medium]|nr:hypothetical protein [Trifolium medium]